MSTGKGTAGGKHPDGDRPPYLLIALIGAGGAIVAAAVGAIITIKPWEQPSLPHPAGLQTSASAAPSPTIRSTITEQGYAPAPTASASTEPATEAPSLYIYTGNNTMAALKVNNTEESGMSPAEISVPGGTIEDKYGSKIPPPTGCSSINDNYPGWWVPYAASSPSRYAKLGCALFQGKTATTIANVIVTAWSELPAPHSGSYISQCLTYLTFSPNGSNPVGADEIVNLYWNGKAWEDIPNVYGASYEYCK